MTTSDLGRVRPIYRGAYSPSASYTPLDFLSYDGTTYFCTLAATGVAPSDTGYFQPVIDASWLVTLSKFNADMAAKANKAVQIRAGKGLKLDGVGGTDAAPASGDLSADRLFGLNLAAFALAQAVWNAGVDTNEAPISAAKLNGAIASYAAPRDPGFAGISSILMARNNFNEIIIPSGGLAGTYMSPTVFTPDEKMSWAGSLPGTWRNIGGPIAIGGYGFFQRVA